MHIQTYMNSVSNVFAENKLLKLCIVVIGLTVLWNTVEIHRAMNSQRTILIPPVMTTQLEISGDQASDRTINQYSRYVVSLLGNFTPSTARDQFDVLLTFFTPETFQQTKIKFYDLADRIETTQITNAFFIQQILISAQTIEVRGLNKQFSEVTTIDNGKKAYLIDYKIINGRFSLTKVAEKQI